MTQVYHISRASWHHAPCQDKPPLSPQEQTDAGWALLFNGKEWTGMSEQPSEDALLRLAAAVGMIELRYPEPEETATAGVPETAEDVLTPGVAALLIRDDLNDPRPGGKQVQHFLIVPDLDK